MDSFFTGSVQSWLAVVVATFSPLVCARHWVRGGRLVAPAAAARSDGRSRATGGSAALMAAWFRGIASTPATRNRS
jgi:hypothetical protein